MLLLRLWNYLRGYVIIIVNGYFTEKFMNICTHRQIFLWDIRRKNSSTIIMKISIPGFRLLRPVARKTGCSVRIVRKRGLPFLLNRYHKRKTFVAGAFLFLLLIYAMSSFVWSVDITGNKKLETAYLRELLSSCGIRPGVLKYSVDTDKAVSRIMLDVKALSWLSINIRGTRAKVQIREGTPPPELVPVDRPCNIVAAKDGIIRRIIVEEGYEAVKEGDTVEKGQMLISGKIPLKNEKDRFRQVHAMGTVTARTWYEVSEPVITEESRKVRTGRSVDNYSLVLFTKRIDLFPRKPEYANSEKMVISRMLAIGDLAFPFELITESCSEYEIENTVMSLQEAENKAVEKAEEKLAEEIPEDVEIVNKEVRFVNDEDEGTLARITAECAEDIGITTEMNPAGDAGSIKENGGN